MWSIPNCCDSKFGFILANKFTKRSRRKFTSKFKTKVVLEALNERYTVSQIAQKHQLHPNPNPNQKMSQLINQFAFSA